MKNTVHVDNIRRFELRPDFVPRDQVLYISPTFSNFTPVSPISIIFAQCSSSHFLFGEIFNFGLTFVVCLNVINFCN